MEHLGAIICYLNLPIMIWIAVCFVDWNLKAFDEVTSNENSEFFRK